MEWLAALTGIYLIGSKIQDSHAYITERLNAKDNSSLSYRSHLDGWQRFDFADEIGIVEEPTTWTDLVKAKEPIGDIDTYRGTHYLLEDDDMHNLNATQGIRWIEPPLNQISYNYEHSIENIISSYDHLTKYSI